MGRTAEQVLKSIHRRLDQVSHEDTVAESIGIVLAIGAVYKLMYLLTVLWRTRSSRAKHAITKQNENDDLRPAIIHTCVV